MKDQIFIDLWSQNLCTVMSAMNHKEGDELLHDLLKKERLNEHRSERIRTNKDRQISDKPTKSSMDRLERKKEEKTGSSTKLNQDKRRPVKNEKGDYKCYNFNGYGHVSRDCMGRKRELKSLSCNEIGHTQRHCPKQEKPGHSEIKQMSTNTINNVKKFLMNDKFNGNPYVAFVDFKTPDCTINASLGFSGIPDYTSRLDLRKHQPQGSNLGILLVIRVMNDADQTIIILFETTMLGAYSAP